ncbi:MAG: FtsX-like permease family protein [Pseudomonadales bacterium]
MTGILSAVFFTIVLLTGNTLTQALRERIPELAVLKTLGFPDLTVALVVLGEAIALTASGGALGLGLALFAEPALARGLGSVIPTFNISATTLASGMVLALLLGVLVGAIPAWQARRLDIISALRQI